MIQVLGSIPKKVYLAYSGGVDSTAILDYLIRKKRSEVVLLHVNHGALNSKIALEQAIRTSNKLDLKLHVYEIESCKPSKYSSEQFWREQRYNFFNRFTDAPIITGHHLDDVAETWVFSSCHGQPKLIPYRRDNVIRPFLITRKEEFTKWSNMYNLDYTEDFTNLDTKYMRNLIRHNTMTEILKVNVGFHKMLKKRVIKNFNLEKEKING